VLADTLLVGVPVLDCKAQERTEGDQTSERSAVCSTEE
jgi:hypothetical protein